MARKYTLSIPNNIDSYWLGFILGDGCIGDNEKGQPYTVNIRLHSQDIGHLEKLKSYLNTNKPIYRIKPNCRTIDSAAFLRISSKQLANLFISSGITQRKTWTATVPDNMKYNCDFWRGLIDADGTLCLVETKPYIALYGTYAVIQSFIDYINYVFGPNFTKRKPTTNSSIYKVAFSKKAAYRIIDHLYTNASIALDRKMAIAKDILNSFDISSTNKKGRCTELANLSLIAV